MLPSIEQYLHALQLPPSQVFNDEELRRGVVETNALGMPRTRSGNFVLVFRVTAGKKDYAVRCFTRLPPDVQRRYAAVSRAFESLAHQEGLSDIVLPTAFIPDGMRVGGQPHPIIKMAWAQGETLGEFVATHAKSPAMLRNLRSALGQLAGSLERLGIAHGDIQPGNIMVENQGRALRLLDYDGVFVPELAGCSANEFGHVNFQHPKRPPDAFHDRLDRFSFFALDLALQLLEAQPSLWDETLSDEEGFVFRANDFRDPAHSATFQKAEKVAGMGERVQRFAQICLGDFDAVPSLSEGSTGVVRRLNEEPKITFQPAPRASKESAKREAASQQQAYLGSYPIVFAGHFNKVSHRVGQRVELIGKIVDVRRGKASFNNKPALRPYIYLDFVPASTGKIVRIKFLPDLLERLNLPAAQLPHDGWIGRWVTITEVIQPVQYVSHPSFPGGIGEAAVHVEHPSQLRTLPEAEARFRLASRDAPPRSASAPAQAAAAQSGQTRQAGEPLAANQAIAAQLRDAESVAPPTAPPAPRPPVPSEALAERMARNRAILEKMKDV